MSVFIADPIDFTEDLHECVIPDPIDFTEDNPQ